MKSTSNGVLHLPAPSAQFKAEAFKAILAIGAFIFVYLLLFLLSLCLAALCIYAGIAVFFLKPSFITAIIAVGLAGCGVMVFIFLIKFLFASSKTDESDSIQVSEQDHPELFRSIRVLAEKIGTPMPKKVFLSPDVNAAVFYNSSFWSLFLPVPKNLKIGLGLVNAVNVTEMEAVIAHEFGHFSQRSMKVGSWVYQVNRVIYNMLFDNKSFAAGVEQFSSRHGLLQLSTVLGIKIIQGIQWVLHRMYGVVNKSYLALSRQMEFHADHVAASVCGSNNIIGALLRIELANECYHTTIGVCNKAWEKKQVASDFYNAHSLVLQYTGKKQQLGFEHGLPVVDKQHAGNFSRINYKDQWSSHPTLAERKTYLEHFGLTASVNPSPAWTMFHHAAELKKTLTQKLYAGIPKEEVPQVLDAPSFEALVHAELDSSFFPKIFKGYYDLREIASFDAEAVSAESFSYGSFDEVLNEETLAMPKQLKMLQHDIMVVQAIRDGNIDAKSFDFDGRKYSTKEAADVEAQLMQEAKILQEALNKSDCRLFRYAYAVAPLTEAEGLKKAYQTYFRQRDVSEAFFQAANAAMELLGPVYDGERVMINAAVSRVHTIKSEHEPALKAALKEWSEQWSFPSDLKELVDKFISTDYQYFFENEFFDNELADLNKVVQESWTEITTTVFNQFNAVMEQQATAITPQPEKAVVE